MIGVTMISDCSVSVLCLLIASVAGVICSCFVAIDLREFFFMYIYFGVGVNLAFEDSGICSSFMVIYLIDE